MLAITASSTRRADVRRRLLAADVLLARLQREAVGGLAVGVARDAHQPPRHLPPVLVAAGEEGRVRAAEAERHAEAISQSKPAIEGAGVKLRRAFGFGDTVDPFLLFDDFRNENPDDYVAGSPWHPHRGIETITYVLKGDVEHGDSMGNKGVISSGDMQWMTAGSGIIHQEMPQGDDNGVMEGFQLWANLPKSRKMMAPRYRDIELPGAGGLDEERGEDQGHLRDR